MTSPSSGSTVRGTTPVTASVSIVGALTVAGVQFRVDGASIGPEDTSGPSYSVSWNTTATSDGPHTLTAVARDILGARWSSAPVVVKVSNPDTTPPSVSIDQGGGQPDPTSTSPIRFTVVFSESVSGFTGGDVTITGTAGAPKTVEVTGGPSTYDVAVSGMTTSGTVIVTIAGGVAQDAAGNANTASTSTDNTVTFEAAGTVTRIEETDTAAITYVGDWIQGNRDRTWSGGTAALGFAAGQSATLSFSGTGVSWIGFRGPQAGVANVRLNGALVATVDLYAATEEVQAVVFTASGLPSGPHTLGIEATGTKNDASSDFFVVVDGFDVMSGGGGTAGDTTPPPAAFERGDVFVSLETGPVQWRHGDGTLNRVLDSTIPGTGEGMGFDAGGNLYVTRWCSDASCSNGNTVEVFSTHGKSLGAFGSGYNCGPHAIVFDAAGTAYVGQAGCTGAILKFVPGQPPAEFAVAADTYGSFWIDLAADGCTIFYTSWGPNVKRFDGCADVQRPDFNVAPLPGDETQDLRVLPDGGVIVSSGEVIARLDASGVLVRTYEVPGEPSFWAGLDLVGDGTFWAANYETSNVYRFELTTGTVLSSFNTGSPPHTAVGVSIKK